MRLPPAWRFRSRHDISIHAPLAGCDQVYVRRAYHGNYFNPRTPCGVRLPSICPAVPPHNFNPRTPCGVRLPCFLLHGLYFPFQSTHPLRGATQRLPYFSTSFSVFQSTHPLRGATANLMMRLSSTAYFNPRTPCGVRRRRVQWRRSALQFQSTHPLRGATCALVTVGNHPLISIHAPLAGCDACRLSRRRV